MKKKIDDVDKEKDFRCQSRDRGDTISRQERERESCILGQANPAAPPPDWKGVSGVDRQIDRYNV